ncbi:MAG: hypothetical protein IAE88_05535 [Rhodobacteraceae bacterium]|nr:hypothetical protein [Paracoccaceae bacterium]
MTRRQLRKAILALALIAAGNGCAAAQESASSQETRYGAHFGAGNWLDFVVYAPEATAVDLLLYDDPRSREASRRVPMQRSGDDWKVKVRGAGIGHGLFYMYRASGPREASPERPRGALFNPAYVLNDPYAYRTGNVNYEAFFSGLPFTDMTTTIYAGGGKSAVYDHSRDRFPGHVRVAPEDLIVYELHVQDYTATLEGLPADRRGTYLGLTRGGLKTPGGLAAGIDHLVELGVNAVELMPVMEYDEQTGNEADRLNHWGYMTTNFFAPEARYASRAGQQVVELKQLVKALHRRGIAVFMDVVYNHTGEQGPWVADGRLAAKCFNLMCLAADRVYRGTPDNVHYLNNTGTGNDLDFSGGQRYSKRLVNDSLAMWHQVYGIDGFRFDLARILAEGSDDAADWIDNDPRFAGAHLHAEPWDLGGQWWDFMDSNGWSADNNRWAKWLGRYRDKVRRFSQSALKDPGAFKQLIEGRGAVSDGDGPAASSRPWRSINLVAVHDGYTLRDCTWFNDADGSQNCWDSNQDEDLRRQREKLLLGILLTSQGVPVILQGDEFGRTKAGAASQEGARNSYNYESSSGKAAVNRVNWIDWRLKDGDNSASPTGPRYGRELFEWTRGLISLRKQWSHFRRSDFARYVHAARDDRAGPINDGGFSYAWEGPPGGEPSQLAVVWWGKAGEPDLMVVYNERWEPFTVDNLRDWSRGNWQILARSWLGRGQDMCRPGNWRKACPAAGDALTVAGRSMAILISDNN